MPTYQYACIQCGHRLEAVQSFSDEPLSVCPACEGRLRKVFSSVGVVFKGSGFYRTDSRAAAGSNGSASTKVAETTSGSAAKEPAPSPNGPSSTKSSPSGSSAPAAASA